MPEAPTGQGGPEAGRLSLRPLVDADHETIRLWLAMPDVQKWWGGAGSALAQFRIAIDDEAALCRLIVLDDVAIGYAQALEQAAFGTQAADDLGPGTWECAAFVSSPEHRGRGLGLSAIELLVREVFETTLALACVLRVPVRSEGLARGLERLGFAWQDIRKDTSLGPTWTMRRERPRR
ncbi:MAG: GNAT family N-acetyltransferase [Hyphomicrobiaceae bacterium]